MLELSHALRQLTERHQAALRWFMVYSGQELPWPSPLPDGTLLASKAKGIYKPSWTKYALSVRQSLSGAYPDRKPVVRPDGTWSYLYFQENPDPEERDSEYTNRGMIECSRDVVPVGVFLQVRGKPEVKYQILGLAIVAGWEAGYFSLEGFSSEGKAYENEAQSELATLVSRYEDAAAGIEGFQADGLIDGRERAIASIVRRRGQPEFRRALLEAYRGKCAISGCDAEAVLEASHILPYRGPQTNSLSNGLLLRADLHILFDLGLLAVDSTRMIAVIVPILRGSSYGEFAGKPVSVPEDPSMRPSAEALDAHRRWAGLSIRGGSQ